MDGPARPPSSGPLDVVERAALAAAGVLALTAERIEQLVDELVDRGGMTRDEYDELELRVAQLEHRLRLLEP